MVVREKELFEGKGQGIGINFANYDNIPVECTGRDCPECFETFDELMEIEALASSRCAEQMLNNIKRSGFTNPTPVQKWCVRCVVVVAVAVLGVVVGTLVVLVLFW